MTAHKHPINIDEVEIPEIPFPPSGLLLKLDYESLRKYLSGIMPEASDFLTSHLARVISQSHATTVENAVTNIDHIIYIMELGKELSGMYEKYEGDMDWVEFVETHLKKAGVTPPHPTDKGGKT